MVAGYADVISLVRYQAVFELGSGCMPGSAGKKGCKPLCGIAASPSCSRRSPPRPLLEPDPRRQNLFRRTNASKLPGQHSGEFTCIKYYVLCIVGYVL